MKKEIVFDDLITLEDVEQKTNCKIEFVNEEFWIFHENEKAILHTDYISDKYIVGMKKAGFIVEEIDNVCHCTNPIGKKFSFVKNNGFKHKINSLTIDMSNNNTIVKELCEKLNVNFNTDINLFATGEFKKYDDNDSDLFNETSLLCFYLENDKLGSVRIDDVLTEQLESVKKITNHLYKSKEGLINVLRDNNLKFIVSE